MPNAIRRIQFVRRICAGAAGFALAGCDSITGIFGGTDAHLDARPHTASKSISAGKHPLDFGETRDGFLYVPSAAANGPVPLLVMFHGATGSASNFNVLTGTAEGSGFALLATDSRAAIWDWHSGFDADVRFLDRALKFTFDHVTIDADRIGVGGFSDGGAYALTMGINNGNLFSRVMAFSPSTYKVAGARGKPQIYVVHGTTDQVIDVRESRDIIVPSLRDAGYDVTYREFPGGHGFVLTEFRRAEEWWLG